MYICLMLLGHSFGPPGPLCHVPSLLPGLVLTLAPPVDTPLGLIQGPLKAINLLLLGDRGDG